MSKGDEEIFRGADEIKQWSEDKLEIISQYTDAYAIAFKKHSYLKRCYIDAFCGGGVAIRHGSGDILAGSPVRALEAKCNFHKYYFIDQDEEKIRFLHELCEKQFPEKMDKIDIQPGDSNVILPSLLAQFNYKSYDRLLCVLDPYGMHLDWHILESLGKSKIADVVLNFPIMDINRNVTRCNPEMSSCHGTSRMTRLWGDESWRDVVYQTKQDLFGDVVEKAPFEVIAPAFRQRLKDKAGFEFVPEPILMKNNKKAPLYYLFFASNNETANKIADYLLEQQRNKS